MVKGEVVSLFSSGALLSMITVSLVAGQEANPFCVQANRYTVPGINPLTVVMGDAGSAMVDVVPTWVQVPEVPATTAADNVAFDWAQTTWSAPALAAGVEGLTVTL